jgi:hypothetical protein
MTLIPVEYVGREGRLGPFPSPRNPLFRRVYFLGVRSISMPTASAAKLIYW